MAHVIGLTGGIASGKSTVARMLVARGAAVVDADLIARQVVEPGQPALAELVARFGAAILTPDGRLDRPRLGAIAFADPAARADLGRITHPRIAAASAAAIAAWADAGAGVVFYEAALLVENRTHAALAGLLVVAAPPEVQEARTMARDGVTLAEARARIAAQLPLADKIAVATWVIHNTGDEAALTGELDRVLVDLEAQHGPIRVTRTARAAADTMPAPDVALVTGFPAFTARRMIAKLLAAEPETKLRVLAPEDAAAAARAFLDDLPGGARAEILVGAATDMDLGLSSAEYRALTRELTWIHHVVASTASTRTILELARDCGRLVRVVHWSTARVSGDRTGTVYEDDLDAGQRVADAAARDLYDAERIARAAMRQLPITVLRPSIIVGDSATGEIDKLDGPYRVIVLVATNGSGLALPMVGGGEHALHLVPIDYVIDAAWHVARGEHAAGRTFHLVDPAPLPARAVLEQVAEAAQTEKPRGHIPGPVARAVLRAPGLGRIGLGAREFLDMIAHPVRYDATNTERALAGTGVRCPALADYLPALVRYASNLKRRMPSTPNSAANP